MAVTYALVERYRQKAAKAQVTYMDHLDDCLSCRRGVYCVRGQRLAADYFGWLNAWQEARDTSREEPVPMG